MIIKMSRESILVTLSAFVTLIGLFYYGNQIMITPLKENTAEINTAFKTQQSLIEHYPPNQELLTEYDEKYSEAESFIPQSVQANQALIDLEILADKAKVSVLSLSRIGEQELLEEAENFAKVTYTAQLSAQKPGDLRSLIDLLMEQERIWNISSFSYNKAEGKDYSGSLEFELYYRLTN